MKTDQLERRDMHECVTGQGAQQEIKNKIDEFEFHDDFAEASNSKLKLVIGQRIRIDDFTF